jgi:tetratricopeptide (TPR) repeat protein
MFAEDAVAGRDGGRLNAEDAPQDRMELADTYRKIAQIYKDMGLYEEAASKFEKALDVMLVACPESRPEMTDLYQGIGECYGRLGFYEEALSSFEAALESCRESAPYRSSAMAALQYEIGCTLESMGRGEEAYARHAAAMELWKATCGESTLPFLDASCRNGRYLMSVERFLDALRVLEEALNVAEGMGISETPWTASLHNNIGICCCNIGRAEKAAAHYRAALKTWSVTLPRGHPFISALYQNLGFLYSDMGWQEDAVGMYMEALDLKLTQPAEDRFGVMTIYEGLGVCYFRMRMFGMAAEQYRKALEIAEASAPEESEKASFFRNRIGKELAEAVRAIEYVRAPDVGPTPSSRRRRPICAYGRRPPRSPWAS